MKFLSVIYSIYNYVVAPFTGAWIEITRGSLASIPAIIVAPFTGAWIEIPINAAVRR